MKKIIIEETEKQNRLKAIESILKQKKSGDWITVEKMTQLNHDNVKKALVRIGSKHHDAVINAFNAIFEERKQIENTNL